MKQLNHSPALIKAIDELLSLSPAGLTEYELMEALDKHYPQLYPKPAFDDSVLLFQHHFMLRHCLYRLQEEYAQKSNYQLEIGLIRIIKQEARSAQQSITAHDPLQSYYLELSNLNKESNASINRLLDSFWARLSNHFAAPEAHEILGLSGDESLQQKRHRYRQLAQQHHPDKGGDAETFNKIQQAWHSICGK